MVRCRSWALASDPALDVALTCPRDADRPGWDVLVDDRPGRRVGAVADGHGGDQHVVAADAYVVPDDRGVLLEAVIVDENRCSADVRAFTDDGVADVRQMGHLGPLADERVLELDVGTGLGVGGKSGAGAQIGERPNGCAGPDLGRVALRPDDCGALADDGVRQGDLGTDPGTGPDHGAPVQLDAGQQGDVRLELDVGSDPGGGRLDHGDPQALPSLDGALPQDAPGVGQLDPVVDAEHLVRVARLVRRHDQPVGPQQGHDVGEVLLALRVVAGEPRECSDERTGV